MDTGRWVSEIHGCGFDAEGQPTPGAEDPVTSIHNQSPHGHDPELWIIQNFAM